MHLAWIFFPPKEKKKQEHKRYNTKEQSTEDARRDVYSIRIDSSNDLRAAKTKKPKSQQLADLK